MKENESDSHESAFVFSDKTGNALKYYSIENHFKRDQEKAGVRRINFHVIRHTFASHFMMNGGNICDLKELLGHANVSTTMRYAHLAPSHLTQKSSLVTYQVPVAAGKRALPDICRTRERK